MQLEIDIIITCVPLFSQNQQKFIFKYVLQKKLKICKLISRSPHTNNQYESRILATKFCLFTF